MLCSVSTTRSGVLFISTLAWIGPLACSARSVARPSQNCAALNTALNTVGELRGPRCQPWPIDAGTLSAPPVPMLWQVLQVIRWLRDRRGSKNSMRPSSTWSADSGCPRSSSTTSGMVPNIAAAVVRSVSAAAPAAPAASAGSRAVAVCAVPGTPEVATGASTAGVAAAPSAGAVCAAGAPASSGALLPQPAATATAIASVVAIPSLVRIRITHLLPAPVHGHLKPGMAVMALIPVNAAGLLPWPPDHGRPADAMSDHRSRFLQLALAAEALRFGEFTLKSGRTSPYFFNAGRFDSGAALATLAGCYADAIDASGLAFDLLF